MKIILPSESIIILSTCRLSKKANGVCREPSANHKYVLAAMGSSWGQYFQQCCHHFRFTVVLLYVRCLAVRFVVLTAMLQRFKPSGI